MDTTKAAYLLLLFSCLSMGLMAARFYLASREIRAVSPESTNLSDEQIFAILPFRNESKTLKTTLPVIASEVSRDGNSKLILVDSNSEDDGVITANRIMHNSELTDNAWSIISMEVPGKGKALNAAMDLVARDSIIVIIDADAIISVGSFESFRRWMASSDVGAVSAEEYISTDHPMKEYKERANILRRYESTLGCCFILEGSLLAWHPSRIGWKRFDESTNADDAQISLLSIRSGHRSLVDSSIKYTDCRNQTRGSFGRSIRRSQGLIKQLISNFDLFWTSESYSTRISLLFNSLLHIIIPWCVLSLFTASLYLLSISNLPNLLLSYETLLLSVPFFLLLSSFSRFGITLIKGTIASVIGQIRLLFRIGSHQWEPGKG